MYFLLSRNQLSFSRRKKCLFVLICFSKFMVSFQLSSRSLVTLLTIYSVAFHACCRSTLSSAAQKGKVCIMFWYTRYSVQLFRSYSVQLFQHPFSSPYLKISHIKVLFIRKIWGNRFTIKCVYISP